MPGGRPLKFKTVEELDEKINQYFTKCENEGKRPFITEMAFYLDTSRETLREYKERPEYVDSIKRALARCEMELERNLLEGKVNPTGAIFNLKNNYGWRDKTETDVTSGGKTIMLMPSELIEKHEVPSETSGDSER